MESNHIDKSFKVSAKSGQNVEESFMEICKILVNRKKAKGKGTSSTVTKPNTSQNGGNLL